MLKKIFSIHNVLITPHQAFATKDTLTNIAAATFYNIDCWEKNQRSKNELTSGTEVAMSSIKYRR